MNKKGVVVIAVAILFACLISGFVIYRMITNIGSVDEALKDFSLETVTDEDALEKNIASIHKSHIEHTSCSTTGANLMGYGNDVDSNRIRMVAESVRGFKVFSASKVVDSKLVINISSEIYAGKGKIAIIQDDKLLEYVDFGTSVTREYDVVGESLILVKIICEDAKIDLTVERQITK